MIQIPDHLNVAAPETRPIIEVVRELAAKGYMLENDGFDLVAVPIPAPEDRPCA